jgi:hypothetical protein
MKTSSSTSGSGAVEKKNAQSSNIDDAQSLAMPPDRT